MLNLSLQFKIPLNQRLYTWEVGELSTFWDDMVFHVKVDSKDLFSYGTIETRDTGRLVPLGSSGATPPGNIPMLEIQDGQQRFTTFCLMAVAFAEAYADPTFLGNMRRLILRSDGNGGFQPILTYTDSDLNDCFLKLISHGHLGAYRGSYTTHVRNMKKAYILLRQNFTETLVSNRNECINLFNVFMRSTEIVHHCSHADPHMMFEARNNRGKPLVTLDLVKNQIQRIDAASTQREDLTATPPRPRYGLDFGRTNWYEAMKSRDIAKLNRHSEPYSVNKQKRGEEALFKRAMTVAFGTENAGFDDFTSKFGSLVEQHDDDKKRELDEFIQAFDDMSVAMAAVLEPANGWLTYGRLPKWSRVRNFDQKRGHILALLGDIFARLDIEVRWAPIVLAMYHKIESIDEFIRCLKQIEKAAFRIYRFRSNSRTTFAASELCTLAMEIYNWPGTQTALVNHILCEIGVICLNLTSSGSTSLEKMYNEISKGEDHYNAKWSLYLLYHYEVAQYPNLMLGSVTKTWQYKDGGTGYYSNTGSTTVRFEKEHIMPNNLGGEKPITLSTLPKWHSDLDSSSNNAVEKPDGINSDDSSYWVRSGTGYPWFSWKAGTLEEIRNSHKGFTMYANRIGNLVLSKSGANNTYSNHPYLRESGEGTSRNQKKLLYRSERDFRRVKNIPVMFSAWNKRTIEDRSEAIARWAIQRFRLEKPSSGCDQWEEDNVPLGPLPFIPEHTDEFIRRRTTWWNPERYAPEDPADTVTEHDDRGDRLGEEVIPSTEAQEDDEDTIDVHQPTVFVERDDDSEESQSHPEPPIRLPPNIPGIDFPEDYYDPEMAYQGNTANEEE